MKKTSFVKVFDVFHFCNAASYSLGGMRGRHRFGFDAP